MTQLWVRLIWQHHCEADVLKEKHFWINFATNLVTVPEKYTGCYNKHSEAEHWDSSPYLTSIATSKMSALEANIQDDDVDHFLWHAGSRTSEIIVHHKLFYQGHNMDQIFDGTFLQCFQDIICWKWPHKLLPIPHFCTLTMYCAQLPCMSENSCQAQDSSGTLSALPYLTPMYLLPVVYAEGTLKGNWYKDIAETQMNGTFSCRPFQNRSTKYTLKSDRITGNTVYKLEVHTLKEITQNKM